jgi:type I restriction enzyme S subunit
VPWIGIKDATQNHGRVLTDTLQHASDLGIENSSARVLPRHTVCLSRTASVGYVVVMGQPMATSQDFVNWVCSDHLDWRFLKHVLLVEQEALVRYAHGTTHQTIYFPEVKAFHVGLPGIEEQRAIASTLGALDDKIESNRRLAQQLQGLLPLLFKPCVAQPEEWITLGDLGSVVGGGTPKSSEPSYWTPAEVAWITPKDMTALEGAPVIKRGGRQISHAGLRSSAAKLLPTGSVVYSSRATLGLIAITRAPLATNQGFISVVPDPRYGSAFVYCVLTALRKKINDRANGSTFMEVNKTNFKAVTCPSPSEDRLLAFHGSAEPLIDRIAAAIDESRTLTAIRDALLPKLVSGQIRVPLSHDPEEQIGAAVAEHEATEGTA